MDVARFLDSIKSDYNYRGQIVHSETLAQRPARHGDLGQPLPQTLQACLAAMGIERLYTHQVKAVEAVRKGESIVVVTSTASGKTLCYNLPVLESLCSSGPTTALYVFPTKALAQDQQKGITRFKEIEPDIPVKSGTYDGDTPDTTRRKLREEADIILTNPDMLHQGILPAHPNWRRFFSRLRYVVIDEIHAYRGVFGSHVANVIRRLSRILSHYGADPVFICCSATIANPSQLAEGIIGKPVTLIDDDGSPRGPKQFVFWNPPKLDQSVERRSSNSEAERVLVDLLCSRIPTIAFVKARVVAELIYRYAQEALLRRAPSLANKIKPYRGGYLPSERREIERQLFSGELLGVVSTNALELGIDVGTLDASIIVGYPGSIASTWQQAGRAGRKGEGSLAVFIAHDLPIDQYLMGHPEYFFGRSPEHAIINPDNPYIAMGHIRSAAAEIPLTDRDVASFGDYGPALTNLLAERGDLVRMSKAWRWIGRGFPANDVKLRNMSLNTYTIVDTTAANKVIGTIDELSAYEQVHPQAVYMHDGETYIVSDLNITEKVAYVHKADVDYFTQSITETRVRIDHEEQAKDWRQARVMFGDVTVTSLTFMFKKIKFYDRDSIGYGKVDLPQNELSTTAFWIPLPERTLTAVRQWGRVASEGLIGIGNAASAVIPLFAMCDPMDIGTVVDSTNTGSPTLFVYDRYPQGMGFAEKSYDMVEPVLEGCLNLIINCNCEDGCPSCVGSPIPPFAQLDPDTTPAGKIPDKETALIILHDLLEREAYVPSSPAKAWMYTGVTQDQGEVKIQLKPLPEGVERRIRKMLDR